VVKTGTPGSGETRLETGVSYVLIIGVLLSLVLEMAGMILFYRTFHTFAISREPYAYVRGSDFFTFVAQLLLGTSEQIRGLRLMILGIAVLILTPYVRALMSVVYFALTRNIKYTIITLFVLIILTVSLMTH
jgi:uncharacterized membrane protein